MDALRDLFAIILSIIYIGFGELRTITIHFMRFNGNEIILTSRDEENFYSVCLISINYLIIYLFYLRSSF